MNPRSSQEQQLLDELLITNIKLRILFGVSAAIDNGAAVDYISPGTGLPAICQVIQSMDKSMPVMLEILRCLLQHNVNVDATDRNGWSALYHAISKGYQQAVELLLEYHASLTVKPGMSAQTLCDKDKYPAIAQALQNALKKQEKQLLVNAAFKANIAAGIFPGVEACLQNNVKVALDDLLAAITQSDPDLFSILVRYCDQTVLNANAGRLLVKAAEENFNSGILSLLEHNIDINSVTLRKNTALHIAARNGQEEMVKILLERGAVITLINLEGKTPLEEAATNGKANITKLLMDRTNPEDEKENIKTDSPLYVAIEKGYADVVQIILEHQSNRKKPIPHLKALLELARAKNTQSVARVIKQYIEKQLSLNLLFHQAVKERNTINALECLANGAKIEFKPEGKNTGTALAIAAQNDDVPMLELLLKAGASLEATKTNDIGATALQVAASYNKYNAAKYLLEQKASPTKFSSSGETAMHYAASASDVSMLQLLQQYGVTIDISTRKTQRRPLHLAVKDNKTQNVLYLLANKADVNCVDFEGTTPLHIAACFNLETLPILLEANAQLLKCYKPTGSMPLHMCYINDYNYRNAALLIIQYYAKQATENNIGEMIASILKTTSDNYLLLSTFIFHLCDIPAVFTPNFKTNYLKSLYELPVVQRDAIKKEIQRLLDGMVDQGSKNKKIHLCNLALDAQQNNPLSAMLHIKKSLLSKPCAPERGSLKKIADMQAELQPKEPDNDTLNDIIATLKQAALTHNIVLIDNCLDLLHTLYLESQSSPVIVSKLKELDLYLQRNLGQQFILNRFNIMCEKAASNTPNHSSISNHHYLAMAGQPPAVPPPPYSYYPTQVAPVPPPSYYSSVAAPSLLFGQQPLPPPPSYQQAIQPYATATAPPPSPGFDRMK